MKKTLLIVLTLILLGGAGIGGFYLLTRDTEEPQDNGDTTQNNNQETDYTIEDLGNGLKKHTDHTYNYSFEYPSDWEKYSYYNNTGTLASEQASNHVLQIRSPQGERFDIVVWNDNKGLNLIEWYDKYETSHVSLGENAPDVPNATVSEEEAIIVINPKARAYARMNTLLSKNGNIFKIRYSTISDYTNPDQYLHLLRTLEFDGQTTEDELPEITSEDLKEQ